MRSPSVLQVCEIEIKIAEIKKIGLKKFVSSSYKILEI